MPQSMPGKKDMDSQLFIVIRLNIRIATLIWIT
jgi:hypothetical protein